MSATATPASTAPPEVPALFELFWAFAKASISGFGGVLPFARHMIIVEKRWLTELEFANLFSFCQFMPGANVVNLAICIGRRFHGPVGAVVSVLGMLVPPTLVILLLGAFYAQVGEAPVMKGIFRGLGAAAAGLVVGTSLHMARSLKQKAQWVFTALVFGAMAWLRVPLFIMLAVAAPISIGYQWLAHREGPR